MEMDCEKDVKVVPPWVIVVTGIAVVRVLYPTPFRVVDVKAGEDVKDDGLGCEGGTEGLGGDVDDIPVVEESSVGCRGRCRRYTWYSRSESMLHLGRRSCCQHFRTIPTDCP